MFKVYIISVHPAVLMDTYNLDIVEIMVKQHSAIMCLINVITMDIP